jgi:site-specific DNA-cytosine methylase
MHPLSTCRYETPDVDMSGSPCQDWTRRSNNPQGRNGKRASLLITWCRIMAEGQPPIILHENVRTFDAKILDELMGHLYIIVHLKVFSYKNMSLARIYIHIYIYV